MKSTTIPILRYRDADKAIDWLCRAFGFEVFLRAERDNRIEHARLILGDNMVMLASLGRPGKFDDEFKAPAAIGGVTQAPLIRVPDPKAIYALARTAGAKIIDEPTDSPAGGQFFSCADPESHVWVFTSGDPWVSSGASSNALNVHSN